MSTSDRRARAYLLPDTVVPDPSTLAGVDSVTDPAVEEYETASVDTPRRALALGGVVLRRVADGADRGWHLAVAGSSRLREVLHSPDPSPQPPEDIRYAITAWVLDDGLVLVLVARARTRRTSWDLRAPDGRVLAEVVLSDVEVHDELSGEASASRRWRIELADGDPSLLDAADELLRSQGATEDQDLFWEYDAVASAHRRAAPEPPTRGSAASRLLLLRLDEQLRELRAGDGALRRGEPAVHPTRVALRRLRAALGTFGPLLDPDVTEPVREELRWAARELGRARDDEVVSETLSALLDEEPAAEVDDDVRHRIVTRLRTGQREEGGGARAVLDSERYRRMLGALAALVDDPPWTEAAARPARDVLPRLVTRDWDRLARRVQAAEDEPDAVRHEVALHDARKVAKRLRYAAETLKPAFGEGSGRIAKQAEGLQSLLGEHQDSVVARERVQALAHEVEPEGQEAVAYERLHARLHERATRLAGEVQRVWAAVPRPRGRDWKPSGRAEGQRPTR